MVMKSGYKQLQGPVVPLPSISAEKWAWEPDRPERNPVSSTDQLFALAT